MNDFNEKLAKEYKTDLDLKIKRLEILEGEHETSTLKLSEIEELYKQCKGDYDLAVERLEVTLSEKQRYEKESYAANVEIRNLTKCVEDKDRIIDKYKKDCDKLASRLNQIEIAYDNLEIIKAAAA